MPSKLLGCPFCGSPAASIVHWVYCSSDTCEIHRLRFFRAECWNTRAATEVTDAMVAAAIAALVANTTAAAVATSRVDCNAAVRAALTAALKEMGK